MKIITPTKSEIRRGRRRDASRCPIALAVARVFKVRAKAVRVAGTVAVALNGQTLYWRLRRRVTDWIDRSDAGLQLKPITFSLGRPHAVDRGFMFTQMNERIYGQ